MSEVKKIDPRKLEGFVVGKHQPFTFYDQGIVDWLAENGAVVFRYSSSKWLFSSRDGNFYPHKARATQDVYYTKEQFKEWIGMTKQEEKGMQLEDLVSGKHVVEYRDGTLRLVLDIGWAGIDGSRYSITETYLPTMEHKQGRWHDIIKVYELIGIGTFNKLLDNSNLKLVWKRIEQTPEQIEAEAIKKEMEVLTERLKKLEGK